MRPRPKPGCPPAEQTLRAVIRPSFDFGQTAAQSSVRARIRTLTSANSRAALTEYGLSRKIVSHLYLDKDKRRSAMRLPYRLVGLALLALGIPALPANANIIMF